ncbi:Cytochrome c-556 [Nymphon striatum]|nr:Cytochrome c-556 [Nymphon striatum]
MRTPYLWAGTTAFGLDCSGLIKLAMFMCGQNILRDSDMQAATLGEEIDAGESYENIERGDFIFWRGHVGIAQGSGQLLHANGNSMDVTSEPLLPAIERIAYLYEKPIGSLTMKKFAAITTISITVFASLAYAHDGATGVIKQRMDMMGEIAKAMKSIGQMVKGEVDYNSEVVTTAALEIEAHAKGFPQLFPDGSTTKPSEALPVIWENWEEFNQLLEEMKTQSKNLAEIAAIVNTSAEIKTQFSLVASILLPKSAGAKEKNFHRLTASPSKANLLEDKRTITNVWAYDGMVPGPIIKAKKGEEANH